MKRATVLACLAVALSLSFQSRAQQELTVSCNLSGPLQTVEKKEVVLVFSDDMVALGGRRDAAEIVALRPALPGEWIWRGATSLAFRPSARFVYATRYRVTVGAGARSLNGHVLGKDASWEFSTPLAAPREIRFPYGGPLPISPGENFADVPPQNEFLLAFDQPVSAAELSRSLTIRGKKSSKKIRLELRQASDTQIGVHFPSAWEIGEGYECTIKRGFRGEEGDLGLDRDFVFSFSTVPKLEYLGSPRLIIRPDDRMVVLHFNRWLREPASGQVRIVSQEGRPPAPQAEILTTQFNLLRIAVTGELHPDAEYRLRLDKSLASALGDPLGKDVEIVLECRPEPPAAYAGPGLDGIDLHVRGVSALDLAVRKIRKTDLAGLFFNDGKYQAADIEGISDPVLRRTVRPEGEVAQKIGLPLDAEPGVFSCVLEKILPFRKDLNVSIPAAELPAPALQLFHVHAVDFLVRAFESDALFWAYDNKAGTPLAGARVFLMTRATNVPLGATDERGLLLIDRELEDGDIVLVEREETGDLAVCRLAGLQNGDRRSERRLEYGIDVFTDQTMYLPGEDVRIAGIVKRWEGRTIGPSSLEKVHLLISGPDGETVFQETANLDPFGGFHASFPGRQAGAKGDYTIEVGSLPWPDDEDEADYDPHEAAEGRAYFRVDYFQADRFQVEIGDVKDRYAKDEPFRGVVRGRYLAGNPMAGESLHWQVRVDGAASWLSPSVEKWSDYDFWLDEKFREEPGDIEDEAPLDEDGTHRLSLDWGGLGDLNYPALCRLTARAETEEGKEGSAFAEFVYLPGDRLTGIKIPYFVRAGEIRADLVLLDASSRETAGRIDVSIYRRFRYDDFREPLLVSEFRDVDVDKTRSFAFGIDEEGDYFIRCDAADAEGEVLSSSAEFQVGRFSQDEMKRNRPEIEADKRSYKVGETARIRISSPTQGHVLITVTQNKILDVFVIGAEQADDFELPIRRAYFPRFGIEAALLDGTGKIVMLEEDAAVEDDEQKLRVELSCPDQEIKPGARSSVRLKVRNERGWGQKSRAFVYAVDEGALQLTSYSTPHPYFYFYYEFSYLHFSQGTSFLSKDDALLNGLNLSLAKSDERAAAGFVVDAEGRPLADVVVVLNDRQATMTDPRGYFFLATTIEHGGVYLEFRKKGYKEAAVSFYGESLNLLNSARVVLNQASRPKEMGGQSAVIRRRLFDSQGFSIRGAVTDREGNPIPGVTVTLYKANDPETGSEAVTDENGEYCLRYIPAGKYTLRYFLEGFNAAFRTLDVSSSLEGINVSLAMGTIEEAITVRAEAPTAPEVEEPKDRVSLAADEWKNAVRRDFRRLLFFEAVETDERGEAVIPFQASDQISTFRVMAVAYGEDSFGSAETNILVSKKLLLDEAMPEFARQGDRFRAGAQVSNRTSDRADIDVAVRSDTLVVSGAADLRLSLAPRANEPAAFDFAAPRIGAATITFYAQSGSDKDALQKNLAVTDRLSFESLLDFATGSEITKRVQPAGGVDKQTLKLRVAPSILKPAVKVAEKLALYPYECLEQRASKVMPYLVLDQDFMEKLRLSLDEGQIHEAVQEYIGVVPEFLTGDGGLAYYRGGEWASEYLTLYVLWSLKLARQKGYAVDAGLMDELEAYLGKQSLKGDNLAFQQYLMGLEGKADRAVIDRLFAGRDGLSPWGRVFLYRALNRPAGDRERSRKLLMEFGNALQVEADFAYFDLNELSYDRDVPFCSSRYVTAMLLQAILEGEGEYPLAPRIMNWLLDADPYDWNTTQTNLWILYAMNEYARTMEKETAQKAEILALEDRVERAFGDARDEIEKELDITAKTNEFPVRVRADRMVYLTTELRHAVSDAGEKSRGIRVERHVYDEAGNEVGRFRRGELYQVEILLDCDKEVPYVVIDEPLAAGFEQIRTEFATAREEEEEFNTDHKEDYDWAWLREEHSADRIVFYSYGLPQKTRILYLVKALYEGEFTWLPTVASGMYHPQYFGRGETRRISVEK